MEGGSGRREQEGGSVGGREGPNGREGGPERTGGREREGGERRTERGSEVGREELKSPKSRYKANEEPNKPTCNL